MIAYDTNKNQTMDIVKHCFTAAGCPSDLGAHKIGQQAFPGLNLVSQATGLQKVKSASDWSIAVPRAPGNTSTHSNDARKQTKFAMAEGSVLFQRTIFSVYFHVYRRARAG